MSYLLVVQVFVRTPKSTLRLNLVGKLRDALRVPRPNLFGLAAHSSGVVVRARSVCSRSAAFVNAASMSAPVGIGYPAGGVSATRSRSQAASQATIAMALLLERGMLEF